MLNTSDMSDEQNRHNIITESTADWNICLNLSAWNSNPIKASSRIIIHCSHGHSTELDSYKYREISFIGER